MLRILVASILALASATASAAVQMGKPTYTFSEADGTITITVVRPAGTGPGSVSYRTIAGSAQEGIDYQPKSGTLVWDDGDVASKDIQIVLIDDSTGEPSESFNVELFGANGESIGTPGSTTIEIVDNDGSGPGAIRFVQRDYVVSESAGSVTLDIVRVGGSSGVISAELVLQQGTATESADYGITSGIITYGDGEVATKTFTITIVDDGIPEQSEFFNAQLQNPTGGATVGEPSSARITIIDPTSPTPGSIVFSGAPYSVNEGAGTFLLTLNRQGGAAGAISARLRTLSGSAQDGSDFTAQDLTVSWADGDTSTRFIPIPITNDTASESDEQFTLLLDAPTGGAVLPANTTTVTIVDDDNASPGTIGVVSGSVTVSESDGVATVQVARAGGSSGTASVSYRLTAGTASPGTDYRDTSGSFTWLDGESGIRTLVVVINEDSAQEGAETFTVNLTDITGAAAGATEATVTIVDGNQNPGQISFVKNVFSVSEQSGEATLTVSRTGGSSGAASATFTTTGGSATSGVDFTDTSGSISWGAGESGARTITVPVTVDTIAESTETFTVALTGATGASLAAPSTATVEIIDSNSGGSGAVRLVTRTYVVNENAGTVTIQAERIGATNGAVSVEYVTSDGTARSTLDYQPRSGFFQWSDGESGPRSTTITIVSDQTAESAEDFFVTLQNPTGDLVLQEPTIGRVTIVDPLSPSPGTISVGAAQYSVQESAGVVFVDIVRSGGTSGPVAVDVAAIAGSAKLNEDFTAQNATLTFADGEAGTRKFPISIVNDQVGEPTESLSVVLSNVTGGATLGQQAATVNILDDDGSSQSTIFMTRPTQNVLETSGQVELSVARGGNASSKASVVYTTSSGTAAAGQDFTDRSGVLTWEADEAGSKTILIPIVDDGVAEGSETFTVSLSNPSGATLVAPSSTLVTISENTQIPGRISFAAPLSGVGESSGTALVVVERTHGASGPVSARITSVAGTATPFEDYLPEFPTLNWASGDLSDRVVAVPILDDSSPEGTEDFKLLIQEVSGGATAGLYAEHVVHIVDDESASAGRIAFAQGSVTVSEVAGSITVFVSRLDGAAGAVSVAYQTVSATAGSDDFISAAGMLSWQAGDVAPKPITIEIRDDAAIESAETFRIVLNSASGGAVIDPAARELQVSIFDNDDSTIAFERTGYTVVDSSGAVSVRIDRRGSGDAACSVRVRTTDGTALQTVNYTPVDQVLSWHAGDIASKIVSIPIMKAATSPELQFNVFLTDATGTNVGQPSSLTVTIESEDLEFGGGCAVAPGQRDTSLPILLMLGLMTIWLRRSRTRQSARASR